MRSWWLVALCACGKSEQQPTPPPPKVVVVADAAIDAPPPREGEILVDAFYIDKTETTVAEYRACVAAGACPEIATKVPAENAMGGLDHYAARTYCAWRGKRLPSPEEWLVAAYGRRNAAALRKYPWGDEDMTCERALFNACNVDVPQPPGRPAGASASGALDMIGNVEEWTEPGAPDVSHACVEQLRTQASVLGGSFLSGPTTNTDPAPQRVSIWFDNRDTGVRCARGPQPPPPPQAVDPLLASPTWYVETFVKSTEALERVNDRCKAKAPATLIAGDLLGLKGWAVATLDERANTKQVTVPNGLVRVVGVAHCDFSETTRLIVKSKKTYKLTLPGEVKVYEMWLPADTWATFELDCDLPKSRGECSFASVLAAPVKFKVPAIAAGAAVATSVEGPVLEGTGGMTCD